MSRTVVLEAPSPGELKEKEDEDDLKSQTIMVQSRHTRLLARKMIVIWTLVCGGLILILWEIVQFPHKFEIKNDFRNKTCLENLKLCPHGWKQVRKNCFFQSEEEATWLNGHENCKAFDGSLAKFEDPVEMESLIRQLNGSSYWIGLNKRNSHKIWTWADESPLNRCIPLTSTKNLQTDDFFVVVDFVFSNVRLASNTITYSCLLHVNHREARTFQVPDAFHVTGTHSLALHCSQHYARYHVPDHGDCAFIRQKRLDSADCLDFKKFICSRLRYCP